VRGCRLCAEVWGGSEVEVEVAAARWLEVGASQPLGSKAGRREVRLKCEGAAKTEAMPSPDSLSALGSRRVYQKIDETADNLSFINRSACLDRGSTRSISARLRGPLLGGISQTCWSRQTPG
jgi:hypothetical protein